MVVSLFQFLKIKSHTIDAKVIYDGKENNTIAHFSLFLNNNLRKSILSLIVSFGNYFSLK